MRINKYVALATGKSRREADRLILDSLISVNNHPVETGYDVQATDIVTMYGRPLTLPNNTTTVLLNKPVGYVCSRDGQGSRTIYDLLPDDLHNLKPVGRLDKDSSGLLLLTNDGELAQRLTHPKYEKQKVYEVCLNKPLTPEDQSAIKQGITLDDGKSKLELKLLGEKTNKWQITMHEGRNRQIRRTFGALGYKVTKLHRTQLGEYAVGALDVGSHILLD